MTAETKAPLPHDVEMALERIKKCPECGDLAYFQDFDAHGILRAHIDAQQGWGPIERDELVEILNEARCLSDIGNVELANRILSAQASPPATETEQTP